MFLKFYKKCCSCLSHSMFNLKILAKCDLEIKHKVERDKEKNRNKERDSEKET